MSLAILDGFCGGGGAAKGMIQAGLYPTGIDINKHCKGYYPGRFYYGNVLGIEKWTRLDGTPFVKQFVLQWYSPPCQHYSQMTGIIGDKNNHPDLIDAVREMAIRIGLPYIIENVAGAKDKLRNPIMLCGYMFNLRLQRHRFFECSFPVHQPYHEPHDDIPDEMRQKYSVVGNPVSCPRKGIKYKDVKAERPEAMGIYHIPTGSRLFAEAIPPAFSRYICEQFLKWRASQ